MIVIILFKNCYHPVLSHFYRYETWIHDFKKEITSQVRFQVITAASMNMFMLLGHIFLSLVLRKTG
jgi:hypothetical protein